VEFDAGSAPPPLPTSIQSLLAARVESLGHEERRWLQVASVIGRQFDVELLGVVVEPSGDLMPAIAAGQSADLLRQDEISGDFYFKHALVRDALYDSMLQSRRAELHLRVAREIERRRANQIIEAAEILAHHYSFTVEADKTFMYMSLAGRKCLNIYSLDDAEKYFRQALAVSEKNPDCADDQETARAAAGLLEALYLKGEILETKRAAERYIPKLEASAASPQLVSALYIHSQTLDHLCEFEKAEETSKQALEIAEGIGDASAVAYARAGLMFCSTVLGRWTLDRAERAGAELVAACERAGDNYLLNWAYWSVAWDYVARGLIAEARIWIRKLIESGLQRDDRRALGMGYWTLSWIDLTAERLDQAVENAAESLKTAVTPFDRVAGELVQMTADLFSGRVETALPRLEKKRAWAIENGWIYSATGLDCAIGPTLALARSFREGIRFLEKAIADRDKDGDAYVACWNRIVLAEIYIGVLIPSGKPPPGFVRKNFVALIVARLFGAGRASALLERAASNKQLNERGVLSARINYNRALLLTRARRFGLARQCLLAARQSAAAQGVARMMVRIDAALAALP
jgi:tetratricopeptide (TPR) repeat protein